MEIEPGLDLVQAAQPGDVRQHQGDPGQLPLGIEDGHGMGQEEVLLVPLEDLDGRVITPGRVGALPLADPGKNLGDFVVPRLVHVGVGLKPEQPLGRLVGQFHRAAGVADGHRVLQAVQGQLGGLLGA